MDECPADECPADECLADECPADECPADEIPADEMVEGKHEVGQVFVIHRRMQHTWMLTQ